MLDHVTINPVVDLGQLVSVIALFVAALAAYFAMKYQVRAIVELVTRHDKRLDSHEEQLDDHEKQINMWRGAGT